MSINVTSLKRHVKNDVQLQSKLVDMRKKRDQLFTKLNKLTNKKNPNKSDLKKIASYNNELSQYDKNITQLIEKLKKNKEKINKYEAKVAKEQKKQYSDLMKSMKASTNSNEEYLDEIIEIKDKLDNLSSDIKQAVKEKELIEYDVFLSHSSLDKDIFVTELSDKLSDKGLRVFEDVKVFKIGQSQTEMMNMGILNSRFVVIFLSENFIQSGWSSYEFKSFLNREINEKKIIILPIWHNVSFDQVKEYNPYLVDKFALNTSKYSLDTIVEHIHQVVTESMR